MIAFIWICVSVCVIWFVGVGIFFLQLGRICDKEVDAVYVGKVFRSVRFEYEICGKRMEHTAVRFENETFEVGKTYRIFVCTRCPGIFVTTRELSISDKFVAWFNIFMGVLLMLITWLVML